MMGPLQLDDQHHLLHEQIQQEFQLILQHAFIYKILRSDIQIYSTKIEPKLK